MPYKCLKCGSENTGPLPIKRFEAEATLYKDSEGNYQEDNIAFGIKEEKARTLINCNNCGNFGLPEDESKFSIIE